MSELTYKGAVAELEEIVRKMESDACDIGIDCEVGDSVEIFGQNLPVQRLADILDTIPYEILTSVSPRVKRVYFRE